MRTRKWLSVAVLLCMLGQMIGPSLPVLAHGQPALPLGNAAPSLDGDVDPDVGDASTVFRFYVEYTDPDGDLPSMARVVIEDQAYTMDFWYEYDGTGELWYKYDTQLPCGTFDYYFYFEDGHGGSAREPSWGIYDGSVICGVDPVLSEGSVSPSTGDESTLFTYQVKYTDADGDWPASVVVGLNTSPEAMSLDSGSDPTVGLWYIYQGYHNCGPHEYYFEADDGHGRSDRLPDSGTFPGPTVSCNHDPVLSDPYLGPETGDESTLFTYLVKYTDQDGDEASTRTIVIGGTPYPMTIFAGDDPTVGQWYEFLANLACGSHDYYFYFEDGQGGSDRLPDPGAFPGPTVSCNNPPALDMGDVVPDAGDETQVFRFEVEYTDPDGDLPSMARVVIEDQAYTMDFWYEYDGTGQLWYRYDTQLPCGTFDFYFYFEDGHGGSARDPSSGIYDGSVICGVDPVLSEGSVSPSTGDESTLFTYQVKYTDADGDWPASVVVGLNTSPEAMSLDSGSDPTVGLWYIYQGYHNCGPHEYYFEADDGHGRSDRLPDSGTAAGPTLCSPVLSVSPASLNFGDATSGLTFDIGNVGTGSLNWTVSESAGWLAATSLSGDTSGNASYNGEGEETVGVVVGRMGLADGTYTASVQITSNGGDVSIPVSMVVNSTGISAANSELTIDEALLLANGTQTATVTVTVRDPYGNPLSGKSVQVVSSRGTTETIAPLSTETDSNGQFLATVCSSTAGESEISAIVQPESVEVDQKVRIIFYSDGALEAMLTGWWLEDQVSELNRLLAIAQTAAQDGDYFIEKTPEDEVELTIDLAFGVVSIVRTLGDAVQWADAARVTNMGSPMNWASVTRAGVPVLHPSVTGRALEQLSTEVTPDTYRAVAEAISRNNAEYWAGVAAKAAGEALEGSGKEVLLHWLKSQIQGPDPFVQTIYPHNETIVQGYQVSLQNYATSVASDLPALTPAQAAAYRRDLVGRDAVSLILVSHVEDAALPLHRSRVDREWDEAHWYLAWLKIGAKIAIPILVNITLDGPVWIISLAFTAWDLYEDVAKLTQDGQMVLLAHDLQTYMVPDTADRIFRNAARGVYIIDNELTPQTVQGRIVGIEDVSVGRYKLFGGLWWSEDMSYSDITIENTGNYDTRYVAYATGSTVGFTDYEKFVSEGTVKLAPGETDVLRIPWKDGANGEPPDTVGMGVVGISDTGAYFVGVADWDFEPIRIEWASSGSLSALQEQSLPLLTTSEAQPQIPTIPNPIGSRLLEDPSSLAATHYILAENPFTSTITATVTQQVPWDVAVVDPGTASWEGDSLSWQTTITPTGIVSFTYDLRYNAPVGAQVEMPPARLTILDGAGAPVATFDGNVVTLVSDSPLIFDGGPPFEIAQGMPATMPITLTNLSDSPVEGDLVVQVRTITGTVVFNESHPFSVPGGSSRRLDVTLLLDEPPDKYVVSAFAVHGSITERVFDRFAKVISLSRSYVPLAMKN